MNTFDINSMQNACEFCLKLANTPPYGERAWFDFRVILETDHFVVIPAMGSLVPGYVLIVTKRHIPSMGHLTLKELDELWKYYQYIANIQAKLWAPPVIFEHGACNDESKAGSCIDHAHWHLVPGTWDLLPKDLQLDKISSFTDFAKQPNKQSSTGYLFLQSSEQQAYLSHVTNVPSQLFRRRLAELCGKPNEWDYLLFPFLDNMAETIKKIGLLQ